MVVLFSFFFVLLFEVCGVIYGRGCWLVVDAVAEKKENAAVGGKRGSAAGGFREISGRGAKESEQEQSDVAVRELSVGSASSEAWRLFPSRLRESCLLFI